MENLQSYLRTKEAALFLGVSPSTLRNWGRSGKIPTYRHPVNRYRLYKKAELEALLRQVEVPRGEPPASGRPQIDRERISEFCRKHHIRKLALFGSVLRHDFGPESDVDVLVEFDPEHVPGLVFFRMQEELSEIIGRKVDLNTPGSISADFRNEALSEAEVQYGEG